MRRFFIGLVSGGFVAMLGLVIVSQIAAPPSARPAGQQTDAADPPAPLPEVTAAAETPAVEASAAETPGVAAPVVEAPVVEAPVVETPVVEAPVVEIPVVETLVVEAPVVEAPVVEAPAAEAQIAEAPAAAATPPVVPQTDVVQPQPATDAPTGVVAPAADTTAGLGQAGSVAPAAPGADAPPALADLPPPPPLTPEEQALLAPAPDAPAPDAVAPVLPDTTTEPAADSPAVLDVDAAPAVLQPDAPLIESAPALPATPSLGSGGGSAGDGVIVNRAIQPEPADASPALPEVTLDAQPPLTRFAAAFDATDAKPLFSIVLIDSGEAGLDRMAIASLPFAVSVAIDPLSPDAAAHADLYRAGGKEVLMLVSGIPEGANPSDLEQTFQALDAALPEAVAVLDTEAAQFQDNRPLATQIVPILAAQGRGLLTWDRGLNAADQVARREGLAAGVIFRQIDGDGEAAPAIRRYLDRAAFKAAQEGRVTVIGQVRPETVAALLEWTIEGRAAAVTIAPVSAQLVTR